MRAPVVSSFAQPLTIDERPMPQPAAGRVLTLCSAQQNTGYSIDGCQAEYTVAGL